MIPIQLLVNATSTEPTIPLIDVAPFIAGTTVGITLSIALLAYIFKKDPTIRWRAQRKSWVWDFFKTPAGDIRILPIMEEHIDATDNTFDYKYGQGKEDKGTYTIQSTNDKKQVTQFTHKGRSAYIHTTDQTAPHAFTPNSLEASMSPQSIYKCKDGQIRRQIDTIQVTDNIPKTSWGIIAMIVIVIILIVVSYEQIGAIMSFLQDRFPPVHSGTNSTVTCPAGYTPNTHGACVPNGMPFADLINIGLVMFPKMSFKSIPYRKYLGFDKTKALITSVLAILIVPSITIFLFLAKTTEISVVGDTYNTDMVIIVTSIVFWIAMWKVGSIIGDWLFKRNNKWYVSFESLDVSRKQFKLIRKMRTNHFWNTVEKEAFIDNWLNYFDSNRPTIVQIGGLP